MHIRVVAIDIARMKKLNLRLKPSTDICGDALCVCVCLCVCVLQEREFQLAQQEFSHMSSSHFPLADVSPHSRMKYNPYVYKHVALLVCGVGTIIGIMHSLASYLSPNPHK